MAKKIIILSKEDKTNYFEVSYLFWLSVPVVRQSLLANPMLTSTYRGATTAENAVLQNGSIFEQVGLVAHPMGTTSNVIASDLIEKFNIAQTTLNSDNKFTYYGTYYDGFAWTILGA